TLLERNNKQVTLTKAGEVVYHHAKSILYTYNRMQQLVNDMTEVPRGPLTIGASYTFGEYILPHVLAGLREDYPEIHPVITIHNTQKIAELVEAGEVEVGIIEGNVYSTICHQEIIGSDQLKIVASSKDSNASNDDIYMKDLED